MRGSDSGVRLSRRTVLAGGAGLAALACVAGGYELVQPVFRLFSQAVPADGSPRDEAKLERYYAARDALDLTLENAAGERIPTSVIHIVDYTVEAGPSDP